MTLDEYEQSIIREALQRADGNKSQAARAVGADAECAAVSADADENPQHSGNSKLPKLGSARYSVSPEQKGLRSLRVKAKKQSL